MDEPRLPADRVAFWKNRPMNALAMAIDAQLAPHMDIARIRSNEDFTLEPEEDFQPFYAFDVEYTSPRGGMFAEVSYSHVMPLPTSGDPRVYDCTPDGLAKIMRGGPWDETISISLQPLDHDKEGGFNVFLEKTVKDDAFSVQINDSDGDKKNLPSLRRIFQECQHHLPEDADSRGDFNVLLAYNQPEVARIVKEVALYRPS